jgi:hypothetical protein
VPRRRWLRRLLLAGALLALVLVAGIAFIPRLLSTPWFRSVALPRASEALGRPVALEELRLRWSGHLLLRRLQVADLPEFSTEPLLSLDRLEVRLDPWALLRSRLDLDVALSGLRVRVVRDEAGRTNLEALAGQAQTSGPPGAPPPGRQPEAPRLPLRDASIRVRLEGIGLEVEDRSSGRRADLGSASLRLDLPALGAPLTAAFAGSLALDGGEPLAIGADLAVERYVGADNAPSPQTAALRARARFPGLDASVDADLGAARAEGDLRLDLARVREAAGPFLPPELAPEAASGTVTAQLRGTGRPGEPLAFHLSLQGTDLALSGPPLGVGKGLGPVDVAAEVRGRADPGQGTAEVEEGHLSLQEGTRLAWHARAEGLGTDRSRFQAALGPAVFSLDELLSLGADFLPEGVALGLKGGLVRLARAEVRGPVPAEEAEDLAHDLRVEGFEVAVGAFQAAAPGARARGRGFRLGVETLDAALRDFLPESAAFGISLALEDLEAAEPQPLRLAGLRVGELRGSVADVSLGPAGPQARGELHQALSIGSLELPGTGRLAGLEEAAALAFSLGPGGDLVADLTGLRLRLASAEGQAAEASVSLTGRAGGPAADVRLGRARVAGPLLAPTPSPRPQPIQAEVEGASVALGNLRGTAGDRTVRARDALLELVSLGASLREEFPETAALRARAQAAELALEGPEGAVLQALAVPELTVEASGLRPAPEALFGVSGRVELAQRLTLGEALATGQGRVEGVRQDLRASLRLDPGPTAAVSGGRLSVAAAAAEAVLPEGVAGPVPLRLEAAWDAVRLAAPEPSAPLRIDLEGLRAEAGAGAFLGVQLRASARDLGARALSTAGDLRLDLAGAAAAVPPALLPGPVAGRLSASWEVEGRLPAPEEAGEALLDPGTWASEAPLPFLSRAGATLALDSVSAELPMEDGRLAVAGVGTSRPFSLRVEDRGRRAAVGGELAVGWLEEVPGMGRLEEKLGEPLRLRLGFEAGRSPEGTLEVSQFFEAEPLALRQDAELRLEGLDRWLRQGAGAPPPLWLGLLGGRGRVALRVGSAPRLAGLGAPEGAAPAFEGPLEAGAEVTLVRGEELAAAATLRADGASLGWGETASARGLTAQVALEKRYALRRMAAGAPSPQPWLSREVLGPAGRALTGVGAGAGPDRALLPARFGAQSRLGLSAVRWAGGPLPLEARDLRLEFGLPGGLPWAEHFEAGLLGGAAVGSFGVQARGAGGYQGVARLAFTGLDAAQLAPETFRAAAGSPDTELSGRLALTVPLETEARALLGAARMELELTRIGSRVLDRALFALDPTESNEAIVGQRRLVRLGGPRWVRVDVRDGNLSLEGEVEAAGVRLSLPRLERVAVAQLPGLEGLQEAVEGLGPLLRALEVLRAGVLVVDDDGAVHFERGGQP